MQPFLGRINPPLNKHWLQTGKNLNFGQTAEAPHLVWGLTIFNMLFFGGVAPAS